MAKVQFGPIVADARNKCADVVYSRNKDGPYTRRYVAHMIPPPTDNQGSQRANYMPAYAAWLALSDTQRRAWQDFADQHPHPRSVTGTLQYSGWNMFMKQAMIGNRYMNGPLADPPSDLSVRQTGTVTVICNSALPQSLIVNFSDTPPWGPDDYAWCGFTRPLSIGIMNFHRYLRWLGFFATQGNYDATSDWQTWFTRARPSTPLLIAGQKIGIAWRNGNAANNVFGQIQTLSSITTENPPGPFRPDYLPGLQLWLQADAITGLNNGDPIATWLDSSPEGNNAVQTTPADRPTYLTNQIGSLPVASFAGAPHCMNTQNPLPPGPTPYAIFVLGAPFNYSIQNVIIRWGSPTGANHENLLYLDWDWYPPSPMFNHDWGSNNLYHLAPVTSGSPAIVEATYDSTTRRILLNATSLASDTPGANAVTATVANIGADATGGNPAKINVGEIIVYTQALTTLQRQKVEGYLAWKWGQVALLPAGHPYKTSPP